MSHYLAFDFGAESGRALLGTLSGGKLTVEEIHRFPNTPVRVMGALYWDTLRLWHEIQHGISIAVRDRKLNLDGIGIDTWGVDYGLLGADGQLLENPRHYRDARTNGIMDKLFAVVPRDQVFGYTGIQFMQLNTLYQLYASRVGGAPALGVAQTLLNMPDLFNYWLTGVAKSEVTIASTTQYFNPVTMAWATGLLERLGIPTGILPPLIQPGTLLGKMLDAPHTPVYATAGHDTAAAVAAVPAEGGENWCYISSGTWSLMGLELDQPIINAKSLAANYTNEVGVAGTIRFLKNIAGLWLLQECRRAWAKEGAEYTYEQLAQMAAEARPFPGRIDPDAFLEPGNMPAKIAAHCRANGCEPPRTHGEFARAILESLARRYREVLENLEALSGRKIEVIHIVGGGSRNTLLNQFVAECTGRRVIAGPSEATAIGNILVQAMGAGELKSLAEARAVVRNSFDLTSVGTA
ncbi:MAG TPA: rhamnulokinase family protein [Candidatus Acidoferrales bacterium]|nr:rhamnulokinase family protein [Candidatus Acidoferrales bacterium]